MTPWLITVIDGSSRADTDQSSSPSSSEPPRRESRALFTKRGREKRERLQSYRNTHSVITIMSYNDIKLNFIELLILQCIYTYSDTKPCQGAEESCYYYDNGLKEQIYFVKGTERILTVAYIFQQSLPYSNMNFCQQYS